MHKFQPGPNRVNNFLHFPDLWVWFSTIFCIFRIYGHGFQKILQIYGYTFEKFLQIYGWCFYDLNGTTPLETQVPPPGQRSRLNVGRNFSSQRIVESWNELPEEIVNCMTVLHFEKLYDSFHCKFKHNFYGSLGCKRRILLFNIVIIFIIASSYFAVPFFDGRPPPLRLPSGASGSSSFTSVVFKRGRILDLRLLLIRQVSSA